MLNFITNITSINGHTIIRLPEDISKQLPSRGQVATKCRLNGTDCHTVIEPDGNFGHWFKIDANLQKLIHAHGSNEIELEVLSNKEWPEPILPTDFKKALEGAPLDIRDLWLDITSMARWEWVRWINSTVVAATRERRIEVAISKMKSGKRRPCCFNLSGCTDPSVSKNGQLISI